MFYIHFSISIIAITSVATIGCSKSCRNVYSRHQLLLLTQSGSGADDSCWQRRDGRAKIANVLNDIGPRRRGVGGE